MSLKKMCDEALKKASLEDLEKGVLVQIPPEMLDGLLIKDTMDEYTNGNVYTKRFEIHPTQGPVIKFSLKN